MSFKNERGFGKIALMQKHVAPHKNASPLGIGSYSVSEAARLLKIDARNIRRWLGGYQNKDEHHPPLWNTQWPIRERHLELGFRDLMELRLIARFLNAGLSMRALRLCLKHASDVIGDDHPLSTRKFQTDGQTIFLEAADKDADAILDLKSKQLSFRQMIAESFLDLDHNEDGTVIRWRPFHGRKSIVIDPLRAFGQPILAVAGIPTLTLSQAYEAEGSEEAVAALYDVTPQAVRDALQFEKELLAA